MKYKVIWNGSKIGTNFKYYFWSLQRSPSEQFSCSCSYDGFGLDVEQDWNAKLEHIPEDFIVLSLDITDEIQVLIRVEEFLTELWQVDLQKK